MKQIIVTPATKELIEITVPGPQGPAGTGGGGVLTLNDLADVETDAKVNKSLLYYDSSTGQFKADAVWTTSEITDGGHF